VCFENKFVPLIISRVKPWRFVFLGSILGIEDFECCKSTTFEPVRKSPLYSL
jgi:hypothetical protein